MRFPKDVIALLRAGRALPKRNKLDKLNLFDNK
jgi:hypothetical protein